MLLEISKVVRLDRVMIMGPDRVTAKVLYEWTAVDIPARKDLLQNIDYSEIEYWKNMYEKKAS